MSDWNMNFSDLMFKVLQHKVKCEHRHTTPTAESGKQTECNKISSWRTLQVLWQIRTRCNWWRLHYCNSSSFESIHDAPEANQIYLFIDDSQTLFTSTAEKQTWRWRPVQHRKQIHHRRQDIASVQSQAHVQTPTPWIRGMQSPTRQGETMW